MLKPLTAFVILVAAVTSVGAGDLRWFKISTTSMEPTILRGEEVGVNDNSYRAVLPARGDIVAYEDPRAKGVVLAKRIVALPLETVEIRHKILLINGKPLAESYALHNDHHDYAEAAKEPYKSRDSFGPISLALNQYFVLGDNRDSSMDSRYHGPVARQLIVGKVERVLGPKGVRDIR